VLQCLELGSWTGGLKALQALGPVCHDAHGRSQNLQVGNDLESHCCFSSMHVYLQHIRPHLMCIRCFHV
jgi:hypothetical protein